MSRFFYRTPKGKLAVSRRAMLRGIAGGAAAALALPTLEAMLNSHGTALADGSDLPRRIITWFFGNGVRLNRWVPQGEGPDYPLSEELVPLANVKEYVSVLSGFYNYAAVVQFGHYEGMSILSGHPMLDSFGYPKTGGPTVEQVAAAAVGSQTLFPSIEVGISKRVEKTSGPLIQYIAHKTMDQPLPPEYNPQAVFNKLFGSFTPGEDPKGPLRVSVLDAVRQDALEIQKRVGAADKKRLDAHLESVNTLQKQIAALPPVCTLPESPIETNLDLNGVEPLYEVNKAMSSLLSYALSCDLTRCASVMFSSAIGTTIFNSIGTNMEHHSWTHTDNQEMVHKGVVVTMECFANLLEQLKATPDGDGNLLDNTVVYCSSDCSEGATHETVDQPILVAGKGGGALVHPGLHYRSSNKENAIEILLACLQSVVPEALDIGSGSGYANKPCKAIKV